LSRVGNNPISIPAGVEVSQADDSVQIKGAKGNLSVHVPSGVTVASQDGKVAISRDSNDKDVRGAHGLVRSLTANAIKGVTEGFKKQLEVNGVGFKVQLSGANLKLALGLSHDVFYKVPADVQLSVEKNIITIEGIDRQRVGQIAADIRELKKPEPYKGKGIRYVDEYVVRKAGKTAGSGE